MESPFISVVVPTYNRFLFLAELMESLRRQTFQDFDVVIVNDCGESVNKIRDLFPSLKLTIIEMEKNSKHVHARNKGVIEAKGEWVMLMDDDDLLVPTHMETMINESHNADFLYSDVEIVKFEMKNNCRIPMNRYLFAYELDLDAMRSFSTFVPSGTLYRKELHETIGYFDNEVFNYWDWDFFLRVSEKHRIKRIAVASVLYDFSDYNNNQSKALNSRKTYLDKLSKKHQLGELPTENFFTLLKRPEIKRREADSKILWDGEPFCVEGK